MNKIDLSVVDRKVAERKNRIDTYAQSAKVPSFVAAMYIDERAPLTTNKVPSTSKPLLNFQSKEQGTP